MTGSDERPAGLPLAMAAVTVAGQCRERSPADLAIFGPDATRFAERFADPGRGESLLAEALNNGTAELRAELRTAAAEAVPFRVALWRQRGGERIRLIASFAHAPPAPPRSPVPVGKPQGLSRERIGSYGGQIRHPLGAIMGLAERMRRCETEDCAAPVLASDILAAAWRMLRLVDDLVLTAELGAERPPLRVGELDVGRLVRRVARLTEPLAATRNVSLLHEGGSAPRPSVLADETTLWSAIENLLHQAVLSAAPGASVRLSWHLNGKGLDLRIATEANGPEVPPISLKLTEEMCVANGVRLEVGNDTGFEARLAFPRERCLSPV